MTPTWNFDNVVDDLITAYVKTVKRISSWPANADTEKAVYPGLGLPFPQEPFPCAYIYLAGHNTNQLQGTGKRIDTVTVNVRIIGGPVTPNYKFNPEHKTYLMLTPVKNVLSYYRYLEDPITNTPFGAIAPEAKVTLIPTGQIRVFDYSAQGKFIGIEVGSTVGMMFQVGRNS